MYMAIGRLRAGESYRVAAPLVALAYMACLQAAEKKNIFILPKTDIIRIHGQFHVNVDMPAQFSNR